MNFYYKNTLAEVTAITNPNNMDICIVTTSDNNAYWYGFRTNKDDVHISPNTLAADDGTGFWHLLTPNFGEGAFQKAEFEKLIFEKAPGVDGGTTYKNAYTGPEWTIQPGSVNPIDGLSVLGGYIMAPAGFYSVDGYLTGYAARSFRGRFWNVTADERVTTVVFASARTPTTDQRNTQIRFEGHLDLSVASSLVVQIIVQHGKEVRGLGKANDISDVNERYGEINLLKLG